MTQLQETSSLLDGFDLHEAYAAIADSDDLRSSDRYLIIDKDCHALHALLTGEMTDPSKMQPIPPPLGNVVTGGTEGPFDATYGNKTCEQTESFLQTHP